MTINMYGMTKGEMWAIQKALDTTDADDIRDAQSILNGINDRTPIVIPTQHEEPTI